MGWALRPRRTEVDVAEKLILQVVRGCDVARFGRIGTGLLRHVEAPGAAPVLLVAELAGEAVSLGRHQRAPSALAQVEAAGLQVHRRIGGGRALLAGEGSIGVLLALPGAGALLAAGIGADKVINRYVRGLRAGLSLFAGGTPVGYFGRDFLSADGRQLAVVSQDGLPGGATIFEAVVGVERALPLPAALAGYPVHEDPRVAGAEGVALASLWQEPHDFSAIAEGIAGSYAQAHGCELVRSGEAPPEGDEPGPAVREDEAGWEESGVADVAIGFAEALVRHEGGVVRAVRFRGDFIAPAFVLRDLEAALVGVPLDFGAIGARVDEAFRRQGATVLGLRSLRVLADAVLAAAGQGS